MEKEKVRLLALEFDRKWTATDFGHLKYDSKKLPTSAAANFREALERVRLRAPPLPDNLSAQWAVFLCEFPPHWWRTAKAPGLTFLREIKEVLRDLGSHALRDPGGGKLPRSKEDGDPNAFANWVSVQLKRCLKASCVEATF